MTDELHDLTPDERVAFAALPRERPPGRLLEERVVRALRARGVLHRPRPIFAWLAAGVAAGLALFAGGFAAGQWTTARQVGAALRGAQDTSARQAALAVQRTGTAYLGALAALARHAGGADDPALQQGREAALAALSAAARELATLAPDDPVARALETVLGAYEQPAVRQMSPRSTFWF